MLITHSNITGGNAIVNGLNIEYQAAKPGASAGILTESLRKPLFRAIILGGSFPPLKSDGGIQIEWRLKMKKLLMYVVLWRW